MERDRAEEQERENLSGYWPCLSADLFIPGNAATFSEVLDMPENKNRKKTTEIKPQNKKKQQQEVQQTPVELGLG